MTASDFFKQVFRAQRELDVLQAKRMRLMALAGPATSKISGMPHGGGLPISNVELCVERLDELDKVYVECMDKWLDLIRQADSLIEKLEKPKHREVLQLRYLCGLKWTEIQDRMEYTDIRSVYKVHGWALNEAEKIFQGH